VVVNPATVHQRISGFGVSSAWGSGFQNAADADTLFSTTTGAGLSLFRVRIAPNASDGSTAAGAVSTGSGEIAMAVAAQARGASVWATPWTPPAVDKSNNSTIMGTLTNGQAFAQALATYVTAMKNAGVNLIAVSAQNEPDANVTYESCTYTGATLASFIGTYMGPALANSGVKIMAPETQNWCDFPNYSPAIFSNTAAAGYTSIIATHEYGCTPPTLSTSVQQVLDSGKEFWETEIYDQTTPADAGMGSALRVAKLITDALTIVNMNAWHYWWVYTTGTDNGALWDTASGQASKRLWIMGNFSRFVRPGYVRVDVSGATVSGVTVLAFTNATDNTTVIVAVNNNSAATSVPIFVSGTEWPASVNSWVTSSAGNLAAGSALTLTTGHFTASLAGQSVTTFVGTP
jgi:glucuronoarabinoxylan endo-1,4-beta-xylanase